MSTFIFQKKKVCPWYSLKNQRASDVSSQNKGFSQVSGSNKLHTVDLQERVTTQLSYRGGGASAYPTNTKVTSQRFQGGRSNSDANRNKVPISKTVSLNHIYRGPKSTVLLSKGARSITIKKGASKIGRTCSSTGLKWAWKCHERPKGLQKIQSNNQNQEPKKEQF